MPRLLIIAYSSYLRDGRVKRHAEALAARGDQVDVICLASPGLHPQNGVNTIGIELARYRGLSRMRYMASYAQFFARAARIAFTRNLSARYGAAIVCSMPDAVVLCAAPLKAFRIPIVLDIHDTMPELYRDSFGARLGAVGERLLKLEERASAMLADRVIAVHEPHRQRLEAAGIPARKIRVVLNSPDPRIFHSMPRPPRTDSRFMLVCHGTIKRRLGLEVALAAIDLLRERIPGLRLNVIGSGDFLPTLKSLRAAMSLEDRVHFHPPIPIEELPAALRDADAGLVPNLPSAAADLMLPVKLLEFATLGIPIVAPRLRTIVHYFGDDAASMFQAGDACAMADAIEAIYLDRERAEHFARNAARVALAHGWERQRASLFETVDSVLPQTQGAARVREALVRPGSRTAQEHERTGTYR